MTVVNPDSIAGITSVTSSGTTLEFYDVNGNLLDVSANLTGELTVGTGATISSPGASIIDFETNGSERLRIGSSGQLGIAGANYGTSGQVLTSAGSGSAVSWTTIPTQISFSNDANNRVITGTGSGLNGEANLTFDGSVADLTGKLRIDISSTGTVGSGAAEGIFLRNTNETDNNAVTIFGGADDYNAAASAINFINVDHSANAGAISFDTRSTGNSYAERLRIREDGIIQIGNTENPSNYNVKDIMLGNHSGHHGITILSGTSNGGYIMFSDNNGGGSNAYRGQIEYQHNGDYMRFITAATERLRIDSSGRALINTTTATGAAKLQLLQTSGDGLLVRNHDTNYEGIILANASGEARVLASSGGSTARPALTFFTSDAERLRITSDGKVGINRTSPTAPITARRLDAGGTGTSGVIAEFANSSGYGVWFGQSSASGASWGATTGDFYWCTGGLSSQTERLRIDSTGNVGLGVIPSYSGQFGGAQKMLQIGGSTAPCLRITSSASGHGDYIVHAGNSGAGVQHFNQGAGGYMSFAQENSSGNYEFGHKQVYLTPEGDVYFGCDNYSYTSGNSADTGHKFYNRGDFPWYIIYGDTSGSGNTFGPFIVNKNSSLSGTRFYVTAAGGVHNYTSYDSNICDEREKNSIVDAPSAWNFVKQWKLRNFKYNRDGENAPTIWGVIAQEMELIHPDLVSEDFAVEGCPNPGVDDDITVMRKSIKEEQLQMIAFKALQEAMTKIESLEEKIQSIQAQQENDAAYEAKIDKIIDYFKL